MSDKQLQMLRAEGPIVAKEVMEGVTPTSNWVVPGLILIGDVPRPRDSLEMLLDYGVECFVDLTTQAAGACGAASSRYLSNCTIEVSDTIEYDGFDLNSVINAPTTQSVGACASFLAHVLRRALQGDGRTTYLHCEDGGPTEAVAAACLLAFTYNVTALKATTVVAQQYSCRAVVPVQGGLFSTTLKTVCRELVSAMPKAFDALPPLAPVPAGGASAAAGADDTGDTPVDAPPQAPQTDLPAANAADRFAPSPAAPAAHEASGVAGLEQRYPPQPAATPSRDPPPGGADDGYAGPGPSSGSKPAQLDMGHFGAADSSSGHFGGGAQPLSRPDSRAGLVSRSAQPTPGATPTHGGDDPSQQRRGSRFAHTQGSGGGASHFSLFGNNNDVVNTPTRRGGRARVQGSPDASAASTPSHPHQQQQQQQQQQQPHPPTGSGDHSHHASAHAPPQSWYDALGASGGSAAAAPATSPGGAPPPQQQPQQHMVAAPAAPYHNPASTVSTPSASASALVTPTAAANAASADLPAPLEPRKQPQAVVGPTPTSNWVVAGSVLCGAKPIRGHIRAFAALAAERFDAFVCLTEQDTSPEFVSAYGEQSGLGSSAIEVRHVSIKDGTMIRGAQQTQQFMDTVDEVAKNVSSGQWRVYVFCDRGHGRTGLFVTALLWRLYGLPAMRAMNYCSALHDCRVNTEEQSSPQTQEQRTGIVALLSAAAKAQ